jgi:hypothetical protein
MARQNRPTLDGWQRQPDIANAISAVGPASITRRATLWICCGTIALGNAAEDEQTRASACQCPLRQVGFERVHGRASELRTRFERLLKIATEARVEWPITSDETRRQRERRQAHDQQHRRAPPQAAGCR